MIYFWGANERLNLVLLNSSIFILQGENPHAVKTGSRYLFWSFEHRSHYHRTDVVEIELAITGVVELQRQKVEKGLSGLSRFPVRVWLRFG